MITLTIGLLLAYALGVFMLGFLFGIIAKVFKDQHEAKQLKAGEKPWISIQDNRPREGHIRTGIR